VSPDYIVFLTILTGDGKKAETEFVPAIYAVGQTFAQVNYQLSYSSLNKSATDIISGGLDIS
jgi:hypothetical protein